MLPTITSYLSSIGCSFPDINLLQPADPFLDTTGEDLRRRIFITQENSGTLFCLRPEFTIPVGLHHLSNNDSAQRYAYGGQVFRQRSDDPIEFTQAGFEDLGDPDRQAADITAISAALGVLQACKVANTELLVGDQSIFMTLLDALEIPEAWRKKLVRGFGDDDLLRTLIAEMATERGDPANLFPDAIKTCLKTEDINGLTAVITDMMLADGLPLSGGRTPAVIGQRIREKAELGATRLEDSKQQILEQFLELDVALSDAASTLKTFAETSGLEMSGPVADLENLVAGLDGHTENARYKASFGRRLDYYTGLVFEIYKTDSAKPIIGGGRYDTLMTLLGADVEIPAVGFAIWVDRLGAAS